MSAEAYAPTATRTFSVGSYTATATLYKDSTKASASTSLSGGACTVTLNYCGLVEVKARMNSISAVIYGNSSPASSSHTAAIGTSTGSTDMVYY